MSPRTLLAVLVYGGADFVPRCVESAARLISDDTDVLVLDDCTPDEEFCRQTAAQCARLGVAYYRSPRNLGVTRNMNVALGRAIDAEYDYVILANSDTIFPANLIRSLVHVAGSDHDIASVTPTSNNVSIFSVINKDPDRHLADVRVVDWVSGTLEEEFGATAVDIPVGVGFAMLLSVPLLRELGIFDPIFGRGYCEENDWCLRSHAAGYRNVLAPAAFVYHMGNASTTKAGIIPQGQTTAWENEKILDLRYPEFRSMVDDFVSSGAMAEVSRRAERRLVTTAARARGYELEVTWLDHGHDRAGVRFVVAPVGDPPRVMASAVGFETTITLTTPHGLDELASIVGSLPRRVTLFDRGEIADQLLEDAAAHAVDVVDARAYPEHVSTGGSPRTGSGV